MYMAAIEQIIPIQEIKQFADKNLKWLIASGVIAVALMGGWYYVNVYQVQEDARAHATLSEVLTEVTRATSKPEVWQDVEIAARTGYRQHKGSSLAPYFVAIEADALLQQGNTQEGISKLSEAINSLSKDAPLAHLYQLKLARLHLANTDTQSQGLATLQKLAQTEDSLVHDEALYQLGVYYAQQQESEQARATLQKLVDTYKDADEQLGQSVWVSLAQDQLERLV